MVNGSTQHMVQKMCSFSSTDLARHSLHTAYSSLKVTAMLATYSMLKEMLGQLQKPKPTNTLS